MRTRLELPHSIAHDMASAANVSSDEVGGVVYLLGSRVTEWRRIGNSAPDGIARTLYLPAAGELLEADLPPADMWGLFHSHQYATAHASRGDRESRWQTRLGVNLIYSALGGDFVAYVGDWEPVPIVFVNA